MKLTRRKFIARTTLTIAGPTLLAQLEAAKRAQVRVGSCMIGLPEAKEAGLDGVEVRVSRKPEDRLEISEPAVRAKLKEQMRQTGLPVVSLMMGILNQAPLASDPRGPAWLEQSIDAAHDLGAKVILVAFFGKGDLLDADGKVKQQDVDVVVQRLRDAAPRAGKAGVILAIENTLPATENMRILDRVGHNSVQCYYDVYNTGVTKGYDVPAEIRLLKNRIVQVHFKNGPQYLDERKQFFEAAVAALNEIGYNGWIILETSSPSKNPVADARRNADFLRRLFA
ncbi:MAG: sugar phosphate isomerase/epimerase [Verrucomicrobiae bacterium]|nr:sugar phosphate isomerase/epimerase [Verrucomicrobiae bacterium]